MGRFHDKKWSIFHGGIVSLSKQFNFKPKEYSANSHVVRSKKIIRTWAAQLKKVKQAKAEKKDSKAAAPKVEAAKA